MQGNWNESINELNNFSALKTQIALRFHDTLLRSKYKNIFLSVNTSLFKHDISLHNTNKNVYQGKTKNRLKKQHIFKKTKY